MSEESHNIDASELEGVFTPSFYQKRKKGKLREVPAPQLGCAVADTHAHIEMLENPAFELARCACHGVDFICAMTDPSEDAETTFRELENWQKGARETLLASDQAQFAENVPYLRIAAGVHPHNASKWDVRMERTLLDRLADPRVCALGEVGLDYHYDLSPRATQRGVFRRQVQIAHETGLPLILHMREAHAEGLAILRDEGFPEAGVLLHCCGLDWEELKPWVEADCFIAYGGPLTFKKGDWVREAAVKVPRNRLLTETDSPYMTPEPMRGIECGPAHTIFTAEVLAQVFGCETEEERIELLRQVHGNALRFQNRPATAWQRTRWSQLQE